MAPSLTIAGASVAAIVAGGVYVAPQDSFAAPELSPVVPRWQLALEEVEKTPKLLRSIFGRRATPVYSTRTYRESRTGENCYYPLEVLIIQDSTYSFEDDYPVMINSELEQMFDGITKLHPESTFAVVSHTDKPISPFGWGVTKNNTIVDWCWRLEQPLSGSLSDLKAAYGRMMATGGMDAPENQYGALINAIQSKNIHWGTNPNAQRLIVISTDAPPHYDGDGNSRQGMKPFSGVFDEERADQQCTEEFFPTPDQAIETVLDVSGGRQIPPYVAFIVFDGNDLPKNQTIGAWRWFANSIKEDDRFVRDRTANSDNFWEELSKIIAVVDSIECTGTTTVFPPHPPTTESETSTQQITIATTTEVPTTESPVTLHPDTPPFSETSTQQITIATTTEVPTTESTTESTTEAVTLHPDTFPVSETSSEEITTASLSASTHGPCRCPEPCPEPSHCKCANRVYLRYPTDAKSVDLHVDN